MANAPSIQWYLQKISNASGTATTYPQQISQNVVDYDAVQAGNYSNVICIRPQFSATSTSTSIGKVRFWWYNTQATLSGQNGSSTNLPAAGWAMKYYVSQCNEPMNSNVTISLSSMDTRRQNAAKMLQFFETSDGYLSKNAATTQAGIKQSESNGTTFTCTSTSNQGKYFRSVWQSTQDRNTYVCMQPIPFFQGSKFTDQIGEIQQFNSNYADKNWRALLFNNSDTNNNTLLKYSVGGALNEEGCNIVKQVNSNDDFPFIFLTIKPPTDAEAGTWSGFSCRMSFIWPYNSSSQGNSGSSTLP